MASEDIQTNSDSPLFFSGLMFSLALRRAGDPDFSRFGDVYSGNEGRIGTRTVCRSSEVFGWIP
jgi:hypothetical protein